MQGFEFDNRLALAFENEERKSFDARIVVARVETNDDGKVSGVGPWIVAHAASVILDSVSRVDYSKFF